jgi:hypothetical protein
MRGIISELGDVEWLPVISRITHSPVIDQDQLVERREPMDERRIPVGTCRSESVQDQKRPALPNTTVGDLCAIARERR